MTSRWSGEGLSFIETFHRRCLMLDEACKFVLIVIDSDLKHRKFKCFERFVRDIGGFMLL